MSSIFIRSGSSASRLFFALACLSGMLLPIAWALMFSGAPAGPGGSIHLGAMACP